MGHRVTVPVRQVHAASRPHRLTLMGVYADLYRYRELFGSLFRRDLRAKYKGSVLGLAWSLALPVLLMLVYLVVFSVLWKAEPTKAVDRYWLFLLCGLPAWVFFATSLQTSSRSLIENAGLIRKVRFPRQLVPLSIVATQVVAFAVMLVACSPHSRCLPRARASAWLVLPLGALFIVFVAGLALAVASANAVFRDVEFVIAAILLPWFFLTPVLYPLTGIKAARRRTVTRSSSPSSGSIRSPQGVGPFAPALRGDAPRLGRRRLPRGRGRVSKLRARRRPC